MTQTQRLISVFNLMLTKLVCTTCVKLTPTSRIPVGLNPRFARTRSRSFWVMCWMFLPAPMRSPSSVSVFGAWKPYMSNQVTQQSARGNASIRMHYIHMFDTARENNRWSNSVEIQNEPSLRQPGLPRWQGTLGIFAPRFPSLEARFRQQTPALSVMSTISCHGRIPSCSFVRSGQ